MRRGVGIWQAIMMILLVSGMMIVVLKYASIGARHIGDSYVREQSELYMNSVIEKTLLAISGRDRAALGCLASFDESVSKRGTLYRAHVDVTRYYLLAGSADAGYCGALTQPIETEESHGMVMLHVEVNATLDGEPKVRLLRRTLQHP